LIESEFPPANRRRWSKLAEWLCLDTPLSRQIDIAMVATDLLQVSGLPVPALGNDC
jgi:hypothetical protein